MANLHFITHAVMLSILAVVAKRYMDLKSRVEDLEMDCYPHPLLSQPVRDIPFINKVKDLDFITASQSGFDASVSDQDIDNLGATKYRSKDESIQQGQFSETDFSKTSQSDQSFGTDFLQSSQADYGYTALKDEAESGRYFEGNEKTKLNTLTSPSIYTSSSKLGGESGNVFNSPVDMDGMRISSASPTSGSGNHDQRGEAPLSSGHEGRLETDPSQVETSVWCHGNSERNRMCRFQNLCYRSSDKSFLFFHSNRSILDGFQLGNQSRPLLQLSNVFDYNGHDLDLIDLKSSTFDHSKVKWMKGQSLIFSRFKPDNIMHVLHDDIFPLHFTLNLITGQKWSEVTDVQLVFTERWEPGDYAELYSIFTRKTPIYIADLSAPHIICFRDVYVGLSTQTLWYQYGYREPQSPVQNAGASYIHNTVNYMIGQLNLINTQNLMFTSTEYFVILSRKENRLILNEMELMLSVSTKINMKVFILSLETQDIKEIIHFVRHSKGIVGMHGSLMVLAAFLQPGSFILELFPYAVQPEKYTPFKTLAELPDMNLVYTAWQNRDKAKSIGHPNWPKDTGGIGHLSPKEQAAILDQTDVPDHLCCSDPSWLYHIYQDTEVDITAITDLITEAMATPVIGNAYHMFPSKVSSLLCVKLNLNGENSDTDVKVLGSAEKVSVVFNIQWAPPVNIKDLDFNSLHFEVRTVQEGVDDVLFLVTESSLVVSVGDTSSNVKVWVRTIIDGNTGGAYSYSECVL